MTSDSDQNRMEKKTRIISDLHNMALFTKCVNVYNELYKLSVDV